ncbi:insulinase family protein [Rathayibacter sp. AY1B7]|uniref:M16 family metallopeptidase n=1 Tax=Rathayibacter sp. AY1B7 TaxID=2080532 RepID=UPI000CE75C5B|nr:insulinase family protein [Rathayibacter sp. AY1B7]PPI02770.1 insulinase family protein [Rathayibacter sp. AY1B7]
MSARDVPTLSAALPSGARALVVHRPEVRNDSVALAVPAGMRHERDGEEGMLHLIEHLVYQDSEGVAGLVRQTRVAESGGVLGGHTHLDYSEFFETGSPGSAAVIAERLVEQVFRPAFLPEQIAEQIRAVASERAARLAPAPGGVLPWPHLTARYWADAPNAHDGSGDLDLEGRATEPVLRALHRRHYSPAGSVLVGVTADDPARLLDRLVAALAEAPDRAAGPVAVPPGTARPEYRGEPAARRLAATAAAPSTRVSDELLGDLIAAEALAAQAGLDASAGLFGPGDTVADDLFVLVDDTAVPVDPWHRLRALAVSDDSALEHARHRAVLRAERLVHDDERLARTVARDALLRGAPGFAGELVDSLAARPPRPLLADAAARLAEQPFAALGVPAASTPPGRRSP